MANILIVDDHSVICYGIASLAESASADAALFFAHCFQQALDVLRKQQMELIILDLGIPGGLGVEMIKRLRSVQAEVKILIFTARDELLTAPIYMQGGASGFLHKHSPEEETKKAIKTVLEGGKYVSAKVQKIMVANLVSGKPLPVEPIRMLSPREKQVLNLLLKGKWLKEIAHELNVTVPTVATQKSSIFQKLGVSSMIELARKMDIYYQNDEIDFT